MAASGLSRRELLTRMAGGGIVLAGFALPEILVSAPATTTAQSEPAEEEITPAEDLMSEHGLLERLLLVYDDALRNMGAGKDFSVKAVTDSAQIIHEFIESYHEKLEEDHFFPRFEKARLHVELVKTLRQQHEAGRKLTAKILLGGKGAGPAAVDMTNLLGSFVRMYRPHYAREDTVLFRSFRKVVSEKEYDELGDKFEDIEQKLFGKDGFENMLKKVEAIEASVGLDDLAKFTPKES